MCVCVLCVISKMGLPWWFSGKESACQRRRCGFSSWVRKIPLEKEMETHSSILAWKNLMDRGVWWATVHGVTKSLTRLSNSTTTISKVLKIVQKFFLTFIYFVLLQQVNRQINETESTSNRFNYNI